MTYGGPRYLRPMQDYRQSRPLDGLDPGWRDESGRVCWRPAGHPPGRHTSRASYLRMQARERYHREQAGMSGGSEKVRT